MPGSPAEQWPLSQMALTEALGEFRRGLLGEVRELVEAWNSNRTPRGVRKLSAAHKAAISAALKARVRKRSTTSDGRAKAGGTRRNRRVVTDEGNGPKSADYRVRFRFVTKDGTKSDRNGYTEQYGVSKKTGKPEWTRGS